MLKRIRDPDIWRVYKTILLVGTAYGLGGAVLGLHLDALGYHERAIGSLAVWFAVGLVLLSIPAGRLVARWGAKRTLVAALAGYAASVSVFPLFTSYAPIAVVRFIDGACSACLWVSCETILLRRSDPSNTGHVMSVYAMAMAIGYMLGPLAANVLTGSLPLGAAFVAAGVIAAVSATYVALRLEPDAVDVARVGSKETQTEHAGGPRASAVSILARIKTSCFAMFRERYQYSNAGFAIAGEMVARAEGTSYSALLDARILGPLGMRDTALVTSGSPGAAQQLVPGYLGDSVPGPMRAGEGSGARRLASVTGWIDSDVMAPGGPSEHGAGHGAVGTTAERAWSLQRAPPRAARELRRARDPQIEPSPGQGIGLDFVLQTWRGHRVAYHGGALLGTDALLAFLPDDGFGFVALSNTLAPDVTSALRGELIRTIFAALVRAPPPPPAPRSPAPPAPPPPTWRPTPAGSPSVEELMARTIVALGGEANLRRHHSWESIEDATLETQGVRAQLHTVAAAPARFRSERDLFAARRRLGTARRWFDGTDTYVADGASMDKPVRLPASLTEGAREENDFYREISWKTLWEAVTLRGMSDVDGVPALVLEKRAASGFTVTDFVSTRTWLPLRHESSTGSVTYADWRWVDRVRVPFTRVVHEEDPLGAGADSTVHVREVRFDAPTAEDMFRPPTP